MLRTRGWTGLAVVVGGLALAALALGAKDEPNRIAQPTATNEPALAGIVVDPAKLGQAAPAGLTPAVAVAAPRPAPLVIKRVLPIDGPIRYGDWHWDEQGAPATGPLVVTVDLEARVLSVFRDGYEIGATAVLLGTQEKPTPTGVFPVRYKDATHVSRTYDGAPMPYTMNLTEDGVAIHGTTVENGYASHGCVGVPTPFARKLFQILPVGGRVYITRGRMIGVGDALTS